MYRKGGTDIQVVDGQIEQFAVLACALLARLDLELVTVGGINVASMASDQKDLLVDGLA